MTSRRWRRVVGMVMALALSLTAAACGDDDDGANSSPAARDETSTTAGASTDDAWQEVVDAANQEGKVTIYSSQSLDNLTAFEPAFEEAYPRIDLEVVRLTDNDSTSKIETEKRVGFTADMWVINAQATMEAKAQEGGWFVAPTGPNFEADDYLDEYHHDGDYFEVGAAILTFGWNTDLYGDGLADYPDLLEPALAGEKIGVIDASVSPAAVDFYLFLEENYGEEYVEQLAAQNPRIYPSALPIGEALGSGEIAATPFTLPLIPQKAAGAPVDFGVAGQAWGTRYFGSVLDGAPHPNAAQVLADFMVSPEGQELVQRDQSSVLPDIPGTLTSNDMIRVQDLDELTPDKVAAYVQKWNALYR